MIKIFNILLVIVLNFVFSLNTYAFSYQKLKSGMEYGLWESKTISAKLHVLKINLNKFKVRPILASEFGKKILSAKEMATQSQAIAVINANFFDPQNRPLGLVLQNGKIKNPFHKTSWWSALLLKEHSLSPRGRGGSAKILKTFSKYSIRHYQNGIQAGPRLVINGRVPKLKKERSPKSVVGINTKGELVLIASDGSVEINQLAKILAKAKNQGGLGLKHALNLDGGSSTQFYLKSGKLEVHQPSFVGIPVGLGVFLK